MIFDGCGDYITLMLHVTKMQVSESGEVPRNAHGNYELWDGDVNLLPRGAEWLRLTKVRETCVLVFLLYNY
jgi:hypothetical protein